MTVRRVIVSGALSGADARGFAVPPGMVKVWTADRAGGGTQTHYQQMVGAARVLGGQLTVLTDKAGRTSAVIGAYFPGLKAKNSASVSASTARGIAAKRVGAGGKWSETLRIDPKDGRLFHQVVNQRPDQRWVQWVDATSGAVKKQYDALAHGDGTGVKGDTKTFSTIRIGSTFYLRSANGRQETYDAGNKQVQPGVIMTDSDDHWTFNKPKSTWSCVNLRRTLIGSAAEPASEEMNVSYAEGNGGRSPLSTRTPFKMSCSLAPSSSR